MKSNAKYVIGNVVADEKVVTRLSVKYAGIAMTLTIIRVDQYETHQSNL